MIVLATCLAQLAVLAAPVVPDLIPPPREAKWTNAALELPREVQVAAPAEWADRARAHLWILDETLQSKGDYRIKLTQTTGNPGSPSDGVIQIRRSDQHDAPAEGYRLTITNLGVDIETPTPAGLLNALATLAQLIEQSDGQAVVLPAGVIDDWPALALRAVHIDLTCQHYTPRYVCGLIRTLARYKVNAILMEYSDQFPFREHRAIRRPDAFTEQDIEDIRRTAAECNQEIIPFLQCLGHLDYVLHRPEYEAYGRTHDRYMLCPSSAEAVPFACGLIDEILAQHPGLRRLNIGGDEVALSGPHPCPSCVAYVKRNGFPSLYARHYGAVAEYCRQKGVTPLMWSDMVLQYPEALAQLPSNIGWIEWDYQTTSNPAPRLSHGVSLHTLDKLSPAYRQYFGEGLGLQDAAHRGGLTAFGHTLGFTALGFSAFTAPAARSAGDQFDLPRFTPHMRNIQTAFRQAAQFKLPGAILTSWSYRGSPQEVCLPEYACSAYGWNPAAPDIEPLFAVFFRQRYGLNDPALPKALLGLSLVAPATMLAGPRLDDAKRAWIVDADAQLQQLKSVIRGDREGQLRRYRSWLGAVELALKRFHQAAATATRNRHELAHWDLSLQHLAHRLRLIEPLARTASVAYAGATATDRQFDEWERQIRALDGRRDQLRRDWAELYRDIATPEHLAIELEIRFDAEKTLVETVLEARRRMATRPASSSPS